MVFFFILFLFALAIAKKHSPYLDVHNFLLRIFRSLCSDFYHFFMGVYTCPQYIVRAALFQFFWTNNISWMVIFPFLFVIIWLVFFCVLRAYSPIAIWFFLQKKKPWFVECVSHTFLCPFISDSLVKTYFLSLVVLVESSVFGCLTVVMWPLITVSTFLFVFVAFTKRIESTYLFLLFALALYFFILHILYNESVMTFEYRILLGSLCALIEPEIVVEAYTQYFHMSYTRPHIRWYLNQSPGIMLSE